MRSEHTVHLKSTATSADPAERGEALRRVARAPSQRRHPVPSKNFFPLPAPSASGGREDAPDLPRACLESLDPRGYAVLSGTPTPREIRETLNLPPTAWPAPEISGIPRRESLSFPLCFKKSFACAGWGPTRRPWEVQDDFGPCILFGLARFVSPKTHTQENVVIAWRHFWVSSPKRCVGCYLGGIRHA